MEYRSKAAIVIALIFFFLLATVTMVYFGVKMSAGDSLKEPYNGSVMVEHVMDGAESM